MMVYIKERHVMVKNMEQANIILKMGIYIKDKCIKVSCKEKGSIHGLIKMYIKAIFYKIKWMVVVN